MLNSKQRAYLRSIASKEAAIFQVGKQGVTPTLIETISEALEKRELVKISILENCSLDVKEIADLISERTRSEIVQIIGRKIVFYRESKTKTVIEL